MRRPRKHLLRRSVASHLSEPALLDEVVHTLQKLHQREGLREGALLAKAWGITPELIDTTLGNAFSQAVVSTIYRERNQYRVVLEVDGGRCI